MKLNRIILALFSLFAARADAAAASIAAGSSHSLALKSDGTVWAWGDNGAGELGDGTTTQRNTPVQVNGLTGVVAVAAGHLHSLAVKSDGTVWAWGDNNSGDLGDGTTTQRDTPVQVNGLTGVVAVAAGYSHGLALKSDGTVWAWGDNILGDLGDGTTTQRNTPVQVSGLKGVVGVSAGDDFSLAVKSDGTAWAWGINQSGELGDGTTTEQSDTPVQVTGLTGTAAVAAGAIADSLAVKSDGTAWAWGDLVQGGDSNTPAQVGGLTGVLGLSTGGYFNLAVKSDGTAWAWGNNGTGELGNGTTTNNNSPGQVSRLTGVAAVAAGFGHSLALKSDGTVWAWGSNSYGQLGNGTTTDSDSPAQVSIASGATPQTLTFGPLSSVPLGVDPFAINATASSGLTVSFASTTTSVCTASGNTVTIVSVGTCSITASQPGNSIYAAATPVTQTFTVSATASAQALQFLAVVPCRAMDTRNPNGPLGGPFIAAGTSRTIPIPSSACGAPANAAAYSLNLTVVPRKGTLGYLSVWPTGQPQPLVSTLNSPDGSAIANAAIVPAGTAGAINAFATDDTDLIVDINGYCVLPTTNTLQFYPLPPCRVLDTRNATGTFGGPSIAGGSSRSFPIPASPCGAPANAAAYAFNVTVVPQGPLAYLTAWPTGQTQPFVSTMNSYDGTVLANAAIVPAGTGGAVSFYATDTTDLVVDINGYFTSPASGGLNFYPVIPCRLVDTRNPNGTFGGPTMGAGTTRAFPLPQGPCGLPAYPAGQAYSLNITVIPQGVLSYLSTWPTGEAQPVVSTLNAYDGQVVANAAIVPVGGGGSIDVYVTNTTEVVIDTNGYFGPTTAAVAQPTSFTGYWTFTAQSSIYGFQSGASGQLTQTGNNISGQLSLSGTPCAVSASAVGTVSGSSVSLTLNENGQFVTFSGNVFSDGNSASGTYVAPLGGCTNGDSGTWTGTRQ